MQRGSLSDYFIEKLFINTKHKINIQNNLFQLEPSNTMTFLKSYISDS